MADWNYFRADDEYTWPEYGQQVIAWDFDAKEGYEPFLDYFKGEQWFGRRIGWYPMPAKPGPWPARTVYGTAHADLTMVAGDEDGGQG